MCAQNSAATIPLLTPKDRKLRRSSCPWILRMAESTQAQVLSDAPNIMIGEMTYPHVFSVGPYKLTGKGGCSLAYR